jgi:hypothetical protein
LLLQAVGRQTSHAGRTTVTITSSHGEHARARPMRWLVESAPEFSQIPTDIGRTSVTIEIVTNQGVIP